MTFFIVALTIMGLIVLSPIAYNLYINRQSVGRRAEHAEQTWRQAMRADGMTFEEIEVHAQVRRALAYIQDAASQAVYDNDGDIDKQINDIAMIQIMKLNDKSPYGRALINVLNETPKEELLYPDALVELEHQYKEKERARPAGWKPEKRVHKRLTDKEREHQDWINLNAFTTRH